MISFFLSFWLLFWISLCTLMLSPLSHTLKPRDVTSFISLANYHLSIQGSVWLLGLAHTSDSIRLCYTALNKIVLRRYRPDVLFAARSMELSHVYTFYSYMRWRTICYRVFQRLIYRACLCNGVFVMFPVWLLAWLPAAFAWMFRGFIQSLDELRDTSQNIF